MKSDKKKHKRDDSLILAIVAAESTQFMDIFRAEICAVESLFGIDFMGN